MNTNKIASITYIPACYSADGHARVLVDGGGFLKDEWRVVPEPVKPVYVRIGGKVREARRWLWIWRLVERWQKWSRRYSM